MLCSLPGIDLRRLPGHCRQLADAQRLLKQGLSSQALEKVDTYLAGKPKEAQGQFLKG
jgi:hypothetical protein